MRNNVIRLFHPLYWPRIFVGSAQGQKGTLEQLESEYKITTPTADNTDLVTTGSILILQKKGFALARLPSKVATMNTYKDGQIKSGAAPRTALRGLPASAAYRRRHRRGHRCRSGGRVPRLRQWRELYVTPNHRRSE